MRKGQYYIISIAAIIFIISLALAFQFRHPSHTAETDRTQYMFSNMKEELNYVVNIIVSDNATSDNIEVRMNYFLSFLKDYSQERNTDFEAYYFIGLPVGNSLNVTAGNFKSAALTAIAVNVTNSTGVISKNITVLDPGAEVTLSFPSVFSESDNLVVSLDFTGLSSPITFNATKKIFEVFELKLEKEEDIWINVIENV